MKIRFLSLGIFSAFILLVLLFLGCKKGSPFPSPSFTYTIQNTISPLTVAFTNTSSNYNVDGCLWNFGDGSGSRDVNPVHIYTSGGAYQVSLQVTGDGGTQGTLQNLTIGPKSVRITSLVLDSVVQLNSPMTLYFTLSGGANPYTSIPQTWFSGNPIATWTLNSNNVFPLIAPIDVKVYWTVQNSLLATLPFNPQLYMAGPSAYPPTVSLRYLRGLSETKAILFLQWE